MDRPDTNYVAVDDAEVAYQILGAGPLDLLYVAGLGAHHIDLAWDVPHLNEFFTGLASFSRLVRFDCRGTGGSGHPQGPMTWEEWTEDALAVLDAAGSEQAAIIGEHEGGAVAVMFAAIHPERVSGLILVNTTARMVVDDDYPVGVSPEALEAFLEMAASSWGKTSFARRPGRTTRDPEYAYAAARLRRASATPRAAAAHFRYYMETMDARRFLPLIRVPTLVLHTPKSRFTPLAQGRYLAQEIADAKLVVIPSAGSSLAGQVPLALDAISEFLTGKRPVVEIDRVLTTVLFTDIVGSTELVHSLGDRRWRRLLDNHDRAVREELRRFRGHEINTTGDGFLASFDGPARAIRCARAIAELGGDLGIDVRSGLHTGECEVRGEDLAGLAVHIAARIGALAGPNEVVVSSTVKDLVVGSEIEFADRGEHQLKGVPESWRLFSVVT